MVESMVRFFCYYVSTAALLARGATGRNYFPIRPFIATIRA